MIVDGMNSKEWGGKILESLYDDDDDDDSILKQN